MMQEQIYAIRQCITMLTHSKITSSLTILAVAIAIFLPSGFFIITNYFSSIKQDWQDAYTVTAFAKHGAQEEDIITLSNQLKAIPQVREIQVLSPDQLLKQLTSNMPDQELQDSLLDGGSPLPYSFIIHLNINHNNNQFIEQLQKQIAELTLIDTIQLDRTWLATIHAYSTIANRIISIIGILLLMGMVLIMSNSISNEIHKQSRFIKVQVVCGVSFIFIKRPYYYFGLMVGLLGSMTATALLLLCSYYIQDLPTILPNHEPPSLAGYSITMIMLGCLVGWLSAHLSIENHLKEAIKLS
ncbi:MAG: permease-like cell division protein FtsX [Methylacidiphilales bacterium]|nr:permease-like cell division protein FtsX [Candidatus Methylacidiphilales bacterium]